MLEATRGNAIFAAMKKLFKLIRRWHTRRIFKRWMVYYLKQGKSPYDAVVNACTIFEWLSPRHETYKEWFAREYYGITPDQENDQDD